ncbi:MAG: hypothetical protein EKK37_15575 [Sphingobacteriales bacterium]|nr:MAG: hypothetical protein EKK37_15575 [Sphingobacteriales bacterium]
MFKYLFKVTGVKRVEKSVVDPLRTVQSHFLAVVFLKKDCEFTLKLPENPIESVINRQFVSRSGQ